MPTQLPGRPDEKEDPIRVGATLAECGGVRLETILYRSNAAGYFGHDGMHKKILRNPRLDTEAGICYTDRTRTASTVKRAAASD